MGLESRIKRLEDGIPKKKTLRLTAEERATRIKRLKGYSGNEVKGLSTDDILREEKMMAQGDPFFLLEGKFLSIKTKDSRLIRLRLNRAQKMILGVIRKLRKEGKAIRIWLLKARQEGVSTLTEAIIYAFTSQKANLNSLIMADEADKSDYLFEISKLYHEQLEWNEPHLVPRLKKSNAKKLEFDEIHSQIIIESAENTEAARAFTYQLVHLSEVSRFRNLGAVMAGLNQSVPDNPNTMIIGETTANGIEAFYDEWTRAIEGKTDWVPLFIPWFWMEEYTMPLQDGKMYPLEGVTFSSDHSRENFLAEEGRLKSEHSLTDEQLNWRRYAIVNKCGGRIEIFRQEYPSSWQEAFQVSGSNYFDRGGLERQQVVKPIDTGEIFEIEMEHKFRSMENGRVLIYERPEKKEQYVVVGDASEALGLDEASAIVLNKRLNTTAAEVSGQYTPEELAHICLMLANYYNKALVAPENKGYGYMLCKLIAQKYGNVYRKKDKSGKETEEFGYNTNSVTRPEYLARLNEEIRKCSTELKSKKLINQCMTFIIDPKTKKAQAAPNKQDGLVICRAIAGQVRVEYPYKPPTQAATYAKQRAFVAERLRKKRLRYGKR